MNFEEEEAKALWVPWDQAFNYLTAKEQVSLLCAEFGTENVQYVFSLNKDWENLEFSTKVSMATPKAQAKPVQKTSGISSLSSLKKPAPAPKEEEAAEEPSWQPPNRAVSPAASPELQSVIAKMKKKQMGTSEAGDLAQDLLSDINAEDLDL